MVKIFPREYNTLMDSSILESMYPLSFREQEASQLGDHLQQSHSVELVGMKRVGINNFLRFFLFHEGIKERYMPQDGKHFFIFVDLNDLIERELFPFWRLTFKRIVDSVEKSDISEPVKKKIADLFVATIQTGDLFLTYDGVREALVLLSGENLHPTLFFNRFDRLAEAATPDFFNNLHSLKDVTQHKVTYVFTSYKELDAIMPNAFQRKNLALFSNVVYIKPATPTDSITILKSIDERHHMKFADTTREMLLKLAGGYVQYLQILSLILSDHKEDLSEKELFDLFSSDERIHFQSEEVWESLSKKEQEILAKVVNKEEVSSEEKHEGQYLWNTGIIGEKGIFSKLFEKFVLSHFEKGHEEKGHIELSKKEYVLLELLKLKPNEITEREDIVEKVWPEYQEYGVSDWSIDRLVARLRSKLKQQHAEYEIQTIRTRGYKLLTK